MIIVLYSQRGGVGKSTTAKAIAAGLTRQGNRVLMIDLDGQVGNMTRALKVKIKPGQKTVYDALIDSAQSKEDLSRSIDEYIIKTEIGDILPAGASINAYDREKIAGKEGRLKAWIQKTGADKAYDYIVIDTPPNFISTTISALVCADRVVVPCPADQLAFESTAGSIRTAREIGSKYNKKLKVSGVLLTKVKMQYARTGVIADLIRRIRKIGEENDIPIFTTMIRDGVAATKAEITGTDVYTYDKHAGIGRDYEAFVYELINTIEWRAN